MSRSEPTHNSAAVSLIFVSKQQKNPEMLWNTNQQN